VICVNATKKTTHEKPKKKAAKFILCPFLMHSKPQAKEQNRSPHFVLDKTREA